MGALDKDRSFQRHSLEQESIRSEAEMLAEANGMGGGDPAFAAQDHRSEW